MSLINEALKKAQRQRSPEAGLEAPGAEPGEVVVARPAPRSARTVALMTLGAGVLVLGAALLTYLLTARSSTLVTGPVPVVKKSVPVATRSDAPKAAEPAPPVTPPPEPAPAPLPAPSPTPAPSVASASPTAAAPEPTAATPSSPTPAGMPSPLAPVVSSPPSPPAATTVTPPAPGPTRPSEQVQAFVDAVRVTGIRASGDDSRVLMNGRQYRLNDLVDRALGVRLVKVEGNCLTFADPSGVIYLKYF